MREVFVDTLYWVARINPRDPWHTPAQRARAGLGNVQLVTTEEVLTEVLTSLSGSGAVLRTWAAALVRNLLTRNDVTVIHQSHESFLVGLELYERRPDKEYSLVDCISMAAMRERGMTEALTNDRHFAQEGFQALVER